VSQTPLTFLATSLFVLLITSCSSHLLETLNALVTVADLHAVTSAVLLVSGGASSVTLSTSTTGGLIEAFACAQSVVLSNTFNVGTSQAVGVLSDVAGLRTLAAQYWGR
jgi:hypothetical protein